MSMSVTEATKGFQALSVSAAAESGQGDLAGHTVREENKRNTETAVVAIGRQTRRKVGLTVVGEILENALSCLSRDLVKIVEGYVVGAKKDFGLTRQLGVEEDFLKENKLYDVGVHSCSIFSKSQTASDFFIYGAHIRRLNLLLPCLKKTDRTEGPDGRSEWSLQARTRVITIGRAAVDYLTKMTPNLTSLDIQCTSDSVTLLSQFKKLKHLGVGYDGLSHQNKLALTVKHMPQLKSLTVGHSDSEAIENLDLLPNLKKLTFCSIIIILDKKKEKLSQHKSLTTLYLSGLGKQYMRVMDAPEINLLAFLPPQLQTLCFDKCALDWRHLKDKKFFTPPQTLQRVIFKCCEIGDSEKSAIEKNLKENHEKLQVVFTEKGRKRRNSEACVVM